MNILLCGGAGYIGSHAAVVLAGRGHQVVIVDNHCNSSPDVVLRVQQLTGTRIESHCLDVRDGGALTALMSAQRFDAVVHFAALKAVGESCEQPLAYFDNNISGTITLLQAMRACGVRHLVFSSSATVYGDPELVPIPETARLQVTNPYGRTKLVMEQLIEDVCRADPGFSAANLRYFNPVGAHPSGLIGESPSGVPNNLMPYVCQVAAGQRDHLRIFGGDWPTVDGTGVRDYLHVMDLAEAHADALEYLASTQQSLTVNLGTGQGVSVRQLVETFARENDCALPYEIVGRRAGDVAEVYADPSLARRLLGWEAKRDLATMCRDAWRWQRQGQGVCDMPDGSDEAATSAGMASAA